MRVPDIYVQDYSKYMQNMQKFNPPISGSINKIVNISGREIPLLTYLELGHNYFSEIAEKGG
jgi:hypothetical protein